jgi:alpha-L-fucosidase 2
MEWKDAKLIKVVIKSTLGGNLRLRVPNKMKVVVSNSLKPATGKNANPFYQTEETAAPVISEKVISTPLQLKETMLYDIMTQKGNLYTFIKFQNE